MLQESTSIQVFLPTTKPVPYYIAGNITKMKFYQFRADAWCRLTVVGPIPFSGNVGYSSIHVESRVVAENALN
jgi:hypothetical protein